MFMSVDENQKYIYNLFLLIKTEVKFFDMYNALIHSKYIILNIQKKIFELRN